MNKLAFLLLLCFTIGFGTIEAQTCSHSAKKSCCKASGTASVQNDDAYLAMATAAASKDATIEKRACAESGKFCFYKNTTDANGKTVSNQVIYDQASATFVNAPGQCASAQKACCSGKKACCAKGAKTCSKDKEIKSEEKINN